MWHTKPSNHMALRAISALLVCVWFPFPARSDVYKDRKAAAKNLGKQIERAQFRKVYVADFLDPSGARTEKGCYFASSFSTDLSKGAHNFQVINRIQAQRQFDELHLSVQDFQRAETLFEAGKALGADAVLVGTATITPADADLFLSLREVASGKEFYSTNYHEHLQQTFDNNFPATLGQSLHVYYFGGLDGVSEPKCKHCPAPDYPDEARRRKIEGTVFLSVLVDEKGAITDVRLVKAPDEGMAVKAVETVKRWRLEPCRTPDGHLIPIRVSIEVAFHY